MNSYWRQTLRFALKRQWLVIMVVLLVLVAALFWYGCQSYANLPLSSDWWNNYWGAVTGVITLVVALLLWWSDMRRLWLESLPMILDAEYVHENHVVMRCTGARLAGAADIRALAQQIGRQMAGGELMLEATSNDISGPDITTEGKMDFNRYHIKVCLRSTKDARNVSQELPFPARKPNGTRKNYQKEISENCTLVWQVSLADPRQITEIIE
ncbi:hypothetical protein OAR16_00530 [bacterium]|nr:hypothetical protein [bacterium]